ncbi:hypothetical protein Q9R20_03810 [Microbacterium sp. PRF11]|jgi:hypothetical protein|uniref:hypothetical protein n=1 Tax=Microbacterium sp. PRF11 TaxID=2962593 RepID=UPI00288184BE|nr:hypothetical protein [Microbacterium sp. PRF11]MDT0116108.1 hypothetical protein [Microbacterium sp. PRF11]
MTDEPRPAGVTPPVAVVFATVTFVASAIAALGVTSLVLDADVIPVRGLGAVPGAIGLLAATASFAGVLLWSLRAQPPTYLSVVPCAIAVYVGEVVGIVIGALVSGADPARGIAAAGSVAVGFAGPVLAGAGLLSALLGVFLVRARSRGPRWGWEDDDDQS